MRARPRLCVIMQCLLEAVKNLCEAMGAVCTARIYPGIVFFRVFPKIKRSMLAVSSMATPLRVLYVPNLWCCNLCAG